MKRVRLFFSGVSIFCAGAMSVAPEAGASAKLCSQVFLETAIKTPTLLSISSTDPFGLLPSGQFKVSIITDLPSAAIPSSKIRWLKDQKSLSLLRSLHDQGVPIVTGTIPPGTTADAFVLPESYQLTNDVLKALADKSHRNILFLQPTATKDIVEHEFQHWRDYEDGTFEKFMNELDLLSKTAKLTPEEFVLVQDAVVEQRGHARQQLSLLEDHATDNGYSVYENYKHYAEDLLPLMLRLDKKSPSNCKALLTLLKKYELKTTGTLNFSTLMSYWVNRY